MKSAIRVALLAVLLAAALPAGAADTVSPPDRAEIHTSRPVVTFRWPAAARAYYLEIYAAGQPVYAQPVATNHATVTLKPEPPYQWRVRAYSGSTFQDLVPMHSFQLSTHLQVTFSGANGRDGGAGPAGALGSKGGDGQPGGNGHNGPHLTVALTQDGDYLRVLVTGHQIRRELLLSTASDPILVASDGGRGGNGGRGGAGGVGGSSAGGSNQTIPYYAIVNGGNGGDGGDGGRGGNGGAVTVVGPTDLLLRYLRVAAKGGAGGAGGAAGPGGVGGVVQGAASAYGLRGNDGRPGRDGADGSGGSVIRR